MSSNVEQCISGISDVGAPVFECGGTSDSQSSPSLTSVLPSSALEDMGGEDCAEQLLFCPSLCCLDAGRPLSSAVFSDTLPPPSDPWPPVTDSQFDFVSLHNLVFESGLPNFQCIQQQQQQQQQHLYLTLII